MAKRGKARQTAEHLRQSKEEIEADRIAAHRIPAHEANAVETPKEETVQVAGVDEREFEQPDPNAGFEPTEDGEITEGDLAEIEEENEEEVKEPNSVVKEKFKTRYIENARAMEVGRKAAKRSNWDWLSQRIAEDCLGEKDKISIDAFKDVLDANGVDHSRWTNRNKGWEGRFRMTGRVALQRIVADKGEYKGLNSISVPPESWIAKYKTKA